MNADLRAWLLEGEPLPEGLDAQVLIAVDAEAKQLSDELDAIDAMAASLPELAPPPHLDAAILALVNETPQDRPALPPALAEPVDDPASANAPRKWWMWAASAFAVAAVAVVAISVAPTSDGIGNPDDWTARGDQEAIAGVDLRMSVQARDGTVERFERGHAYHAGETLLFRVDAHAPGWVHLVRVDTDSAQVVHQQEMTAGTSDLRTDGGFVGYSLEEGETSAVFAVIRSDSPLSADQLAAALAVGPDVDDVCAAARGLGGRCSAEYVEGTR